MKSLGARPTVWYAVAAPSALGCPLLLGYEQLHWQISACLDSNYQMLTVRYSLNCDRQATHRWESRSTR